MRTSLGFLALACLLAAPLAATSAQEVTWRSYSEGQVVGLKAGKPLAVFVGAGRAGHEQINQDGSYNGEIRKILADRYVCVYLDANRPEDQPTIRQFGIHYGTGLVLSDRTGQLQAFHHDGTLSGSDLSRQLRRFADPFLVVDTTRTAGAERVSFYPPPAMSQDVVPASFAAPAPLFQQQPVFAQPSFRSFGGGGASC